MESIKKYRIINTIVTVIGVLLCIVSGFTPAPHGLLTEGRATIIQALSGPQKLVLFVLPTVLLAVAAMIVASGRYSIAALIAVLAGSSLLAWMDLAFVQGLQSFNGILINEAGIVLAVAGVLLHAFGMPKNKAKKKVAEIVAETSDPIDDALWYGRQEDFYDSADDAVVDASVGRDTMELRDTLVTALRAITETDVEDNPAAKIIDIASEVPEEEASHAVDLDRAVWYSDFELAMLLRDKSKEIEATVADEIPEIVTTEDIAEAYRLEDDNNETARAGEELESESITNFYTGLEDMFKN